MGAQHFWLWLLYLVHLCISICASGMLLIVILLLRRFDVFHTNLRTLLWQTLLCILLNNCTQMLRPFMTLIQNTFFEHSSQFDVSQCADINCLPAPFCAFISTSGVFICMERLYATFNYAKYEGEDFQFILYRLFAAMWLFFAIYSLGNSVLDLWPALASTSPYFKCQIFYLQINPLKTHWHLLISLLFHGVFGLVLYVVLSVNKEKQEVYVKFHYSSLSHRFQIGENVKSVRLLLKLIPQLALAISLLMFHAIWLHWRVTASAQEAGNSNNKNMDNHLAAESDGWLLLWAESALLVMPTFCLSMAYTIVSSSNVFKSKAKLVASQLWLQVRHSGQSAVEAKKLEEDL